MPSISDEKRARMEQLFGAPWPFPDGLCGKCLATMYKEDPSVRARFDEWSAKARKVAVDKIGADLRQAVNTSLDFADRIAERVRTAFD